MVGEVKKTEGSGLRFYMGCSRAASLRDDILVKNKGINGVRYLGERLSRQRKYQSKGPKYQSKGLAAREGE